MPVLELVPFQSLEKHFGETTARADAVDADPQCSIPRTIEIVRLSDKLESHRQCQLQWSPPDKMCSAERGDTTPLAAPFVHGWETFIVEAFEVEL